MIKNLFNNFENIKKEWVELKKTGDAFKGRSHRFFLFISKKISSERDDHDHDHDHVCYKYKAMCYKVFPLCYNRNPKNPNPTMNTDLNFLLKYLLI